MKDDGYGLGDIARAIGELESSGVDRSIDDLHTTFVAINENLDSIAMSLLRLADKIAPEDDGKPPAPLVVDTPQFDEPKKMVRRKKR